MSTIKKLKEILQKYPEEMMVGVAIQEHPRDTGEYDGLRYEIIDEKTISKQDAHPDEELSSDLGTLLLHTIPAWWYAGVEDHISEKLYAKLGKLQNAEDLKMYLDFQIGKVEYEDVPPRIWGLMG